MEDERFPTATMSTSPGFEDLPEGDGVIVLSPQGRILSASLQAERLLRREVRRGRLLPLEELFSPAALPQAAAACREALQDGMASSNLLGEVKPGPGPAFFLHYSVLPLFNQKDKITGLILVFRDSTLSRAWSAWNGHRREVGPEAALEHYHRGVFIIDRLFRITSFNRMARELTGFGPKEVLGKHCWEVLRSNRDRKSVV